MAVRLKGACSARSGKNSDMVPQRRFGIDALYSKGSRTATPNRELQEYVD